jgi:Ca2+-transporting ATPase
VADRLSTDVARGLTQDEAARRLASGPNVLPRPTPPSLGELVLAQLRETMIVVLLAAAVLTVVVGDLADATIIAIVVALNTTLGVLQQQRAQRAIAALSSLAAPTAQVRRGGAAALIDAADVVPGDLMVVAAGDLVAADGRLVQAEGLEVDEAPLTGESVPVRKTTEPCDPGTGVADRLSMLHAGTTVTRGRARVVVTATASDTQVGQLARLLVTTTAPPTPLQLRLARFGRQIAVADVALSLVVLVLGLLRGEGVERMVLTAISLAVAAVPESLPAVVVLSLALSAQRMARHAAVVRTLPAVETLGSVTVIASDKTGTLTEGTMRVSAVWTPDDTDDLLLRAVVLCNDARLVDGDATAGDPMEGALLLLARERGSTAMPYDAARRASASGRSSTSGPA